MRMLFAAILALVATTEAWAAEPVAKNFAPMDLASIDTPLAFPKPTATAPTLDGKLDDACWQTAVKVGSLRDSMTGLDALEPGNIWLCYDKKAIYIAVDVEEGQPDHLAGKPQGEKQDVWGGDELELFIAPHGDGKTYYHLCVGPKYGQRYDARNDIGRDYHSEDWKVAYEVDKDAGRWRTEFAIPYSAFDMDGPPTGTMWGFNVARMNIHTVEPSAEFGIHGADNSKELTQWSPTGQSFHTVAKFGRLFFGSADEFKQRREPLDASLVLDRYSYDALDANGVGVLLARPGGRDYADLSAMLTLVKGKDIKGVTHGVDVTSAYTSFQMPVDQLEPGDYKLIATLIAQDAAPATAMWDFTVTASSLAEGVTRSGRIPLILPPRDDDKQGFAWPVRTGVPFPRGALDDASHVRLLANGVPVPCQTSVRATWGPDASVRWLGLSFVAHEHDVKYELEYGPNVTPANITHRVTAKTSDTGVTVNTGPLSFVVSKAGITTATLNGNTVIQGDQTTSPYLVDEAGTIYRTSLSDDVTVEVEESGPIHAAVRVSGWFAAENGDKLCKFTTYYEAFTGLPHVFVDHSVVITYDTTTNKLRDVGFPVAAQGDHYGIGVLDGAPITGSRTDRAYVIQDRFNHFTVSGDAKSDGTKLSGWADVGTNKQGVTLSGQYVWQRYPLEFSVNGKALTYHLWPADLGDTFTDEEELARADIYKLLSAHEGPALDLTMPKAYFDRVAKHAQEEGFYLIYAKKGMESNGQGVALNEPFVLTFRDQPLRAEKADAFARLNEKNPHAIADPKWTSLSQAMGPIGAVDRENYPNVARFAGPVWLSQTWQPLREAEDYGKFNFGDVHTYFRPTSTNERRVGLHRVWLNHHYSQNEMPWLLYAFYGEHKYLDWARVSNLHTMNVDVVHYEDPNNPLRFHSLGAMYHVKGFMHWGYDTQVTGHNAWATYLNWNWLMTGNRRARDVGNEWVKGVIQTQPSGGTGREGQNALGHLANYYQHRFDPRLLWLMHNFSVSVKSEPLADQAATYWNPSTWYTYDTLRRDPEMVEMLRVPEYRIERYAEMKMHLTAYFYLKTGDESYLEPLQNLYELMGCQFDSPGHPYDGFQQYKFLDLGLLSHQLMVIQKAFAKAGRLIRPSEKLLRPSLVEDGPYTRESPRQYTMGVMKAAKQTIMINADDDAELAKRITITSPDGQPIDAISTDARPGLYTIQVNSSKLINVIGAEPFFVVRAGQQAGLLNYTLATIAPLEGDGPINLKITIGDKRPTRLAILDKNDNEIASASSWRYESNSIKDLTVPAGGPWRLAVPYCATIVPDRDIKLILHGPTPSTPQEQ